MLLESLIDAVEASRSSLPFISRRNTKEAGLTGCWLHGPAAPPVHHADALLGWRVPPCRCLANFVDITGEVAKVSVELEKLLHESRCQVRCVDYYAL
jgi:hypothetical protein